MNEPALRGSVPRAVVCALTPVLFAACASVSSTPRDLEGEDDGVFTAAFRTSIDLRDRPQDTSGSDVSAPVAHSWRRVLFLDVDVAHGEGEDTQNLPTASSFIRYGGTTFTGPVTIAQDFQLTSASVAARIGGRYRDRFTVAGIVGLGAVELDLDLSSAGLSASDSTTAVGPLIGFRLDWHAMSWLGISLRNALMVGVGEDVTFYSGELLMHVRPAQHVGLFGGLRGWNYGEDLSPSDVDLMIQGPTVGLELFF